MIVQCANLLILEKFYKIDTPFRKMGLKNAETRFGVKYNFSSFVLYGAEKHISTLHRWRFFVDDVHRDAYWY